jgi:hypothetical protein
MQNKKKPDKKKNKTLEWLLRLSLAVITIGLGVYIFQFQDMKWSNETQDWGAFGEYLNFIITVVNTAILGYLSFLVVETQQKRDSFETSYIEAEEKPILIFAVDAVLNQWYVYNVGKGAALNVVVSRRTFGGDWIDSRKCYSLAPEEKFVINWFREAYSISGVYSDSVSKKVFTSICVGDETNQQIFEDTEIDENHWTIIVRKNAVRLTP